ncbi:hypothetical protein ABZ379_00080 [Streptomyces canus]|uniref:hypothetical protein n=1 Tax=Streptomyces canus TaxID=58343 RepID=UPI0033D34CB6
MLLALAYLMVVFGLDCLSVEQGRDAAALVLSVITFPSGFVTTIVFLLAAVVFGFDDYSPGPDTYVPSVHAMAGIVQVVLIWLVLRALKGRRARPPSRNIRKGRARIWGIR